MTHPGKTQNRKEADARERLIQAGIEAFGRHGFDGASTRRLAAEAGVNIAAIPYYFGGKEGLYKAVAAHIVERIRERMAPEIAAAHGLAAREDASREELIGGVKGLLAGLTFAMIGTPEARRWARIIMQEYIKPSETFEIFFQGVVKRLFGACGALLTRLTGLPPEGEDLAFLTQAMVGQVLVFRLGEQVLLRRLGQEAVTPDQVAKLARLVAANAEAIIRGESWRMAASGKGSEA